MKKIFIELAAASFAILVGLNFSSSQVKAQENQNNNDQNSQVVVTFDEPDFEGDAPKGRQRGFASRSCDIVKLSIIPLVPSDSRGLTIKQSPTIWVNLTYDQKLNNKNQPEIIGNFSLEDIKSNVKVVKDATIKLPNDSRNLKIEIPYSLQEGNWYRWYLVIPQDHLDCAVDGSNSTNIISVEGLIQRVSSIHDTTNAVKQKSEELLTLYSQNGLWYDALDEAAKLKCQRPPLLEPWNNLLKQAEFNAKELRNISQAWSCYK